MSLNLAAKEDNELILKLYSLIMVITGFASFPDFDAAFSELCIGILALVYLLLIKDRKNIKYTEIIATIA